MAGVHLPAHHVACWSRGIGIFCCATVIFRCGSRQLRAQRDWFWLSGEMRSFASRTSAITFVALLRWWIGIDFAVRESSESAHTHTQANLIILYTMCSGQTANENAWLGRRAQRRRKNCTNQRPNRIKPVTMVSARIFFFFWFFVVVVGRVCAVCVAYRREFASAFFCFLFLVLVRENSAFSLLALLFGFRSFVVWIFTWLLPALVYLLAFWASVCQSLALWQRPKRKKQQTAVGHGGNCRLCIYWFRLSFRSSSPHSHEVREMNFWSFDIFVDFTITRSSSIERKYFSIECGGLFLLRSHVCASMPILQRIL